jgi:hypothetical protein
MDENQILSDHVEKEPDLDKPPAPILAELKEKVRIEAEERGPDIAGFWRRWFAFTIDGICIYVIQFY